MYSLKMDDLPKEAIEAMPDGLYKYGYDCYCVSYAHPKANSYYTAADTFSMTEGAATNIRIYMRKARYL